MLKAAGEKFNVATKMFWNKFHSAWAALDDDRLQLYKKMTDNEKTISKQARRGERTLAAAALPTLPALLAPPAPATPVYVLVGKSEPSPDACRQRS